MIELAVQVVCIQPKKYCVCHYFAELRCSPKIWCWRAAKRPPCSPRPECASCGRSADPTPRVEKSHARLNLLGSIVPTSCSSGSLRPGGANPVAVGRRLVLLRLPPHLPTHLLPFPSPTRLLPFPSTAATILIASPALGKKKSEPVWLVAESSSPAWEPSHLPPAAFVGFSWPPGRAALLSLSASPTFQARESDDRGLAPPCQLFDGRRSAGRQAYSFPSMSKCRP